MIFPFLLPSSALPSSSFWSTISSFHTQNLVGRVSTLASHNLTAWASDLSPSRLLSSPLQKLISTHLTPLLTRSTSAPPTTSLSDRVGLSLSSYNYYSYTTVVATLIALIYLLCSMTSYGRIPLTSWGGRRSPHSSAAGDRSLTDYDFEYVGPDYSDGSRPPPHDHRPSVPRNHGYYDEEGPDVILVRHMNTQYELEFKPFAISDGLLRVSDIRMYAAEKLGAPDPSRLRLLYKGKQLKDDKLPAKEYGLKQQSEIMVVISATPPSRPNSESEAEESGSTVSHISKKAKGHRRRTKHKTSANLAPPPDDNGSSSNKGSGRGSRVPSPHPRPAPLHSPPSHPQPPHSPATTSPSLQSPPLQSPPMQSPRSDSARGKVDQLTSIFHTQWVPKCVQFLLHPPSDAKAREQEHKRLSESILAQIMLKADNIEMEGDTQARADRKKLLSEINDMFKKLDAVAKGHGF